MSILNQYAKMPIRSIITNAHFFVQKFLKNDNLLAYVRNSILYKSFETVNQEWKLSLEQKKPQHIHGNSKSKFIGMHCMSIGFRRLPAAKGGGYYRVLGLYDGADPIKDNLIIKAEFGDKITEKPESHVVTGLIVQTCLLALKTADFEGLEDIGENGLDADPENKGLERK
ncbi:hypothetical protein C0989_002326 [Termitomyces sp. Mn162]|nr:hypothetical protein C0989_002326 [Termitomyces sp. Mn162]